MNTSYLQASYGNKKFIVSIMTALEELRADDFVQLYLQAQDPSVYKHKLEEGDVHTKLLAEIADNSRICKIEKERGSIILQAVYAAPSIANTTKAMAMLMAGATLEYDDFASRFGSGCELEPQALDPYSYSPWNILHHAFTAGVDQSDDVRFLIDKTKIGETLYKDFRAAGHFQTPFLFVAGFNFTQESFAQFFDSIPDDRKSDVLQHAPQGFYGSDYFAGLIDNGFVPDLGISQIAVSALYKAGRVETFEKLLPQIFVVNDADNIGRASGMSRLFYGKPGEKLTAEQSQMQSSFKEAYKAFTSEMISGDDNTSIYTRYGFIRDTLMNAFIADSFDDFSRILSEAVDAYPVQSGRQDIFDDLYSYVAKYAQQHIVNFGATKNVKAMLTLVKDTMVVRMNEAVDLVNLLPEVTPDKQEKNDRKYQGIGPENERWYSHESRHCR